MNQMSESHLDRAELRIQQAVEAYEREDMGIADLTSAVGLLIGAVLEVTLHLRDEKK